MIRPGTARKPRKRSGRSTIPFRASVGICRRRGCGTKPGKPRLEREVDAEIRRAVEEAEADREFDPADMFDYVFATKPPYLKAQQEELRAALSRGQEVLPWLSSPWSRQSISPSDRRWPATRMWSCWAKMSASTAACFGSPKASTSVRRRSRHRHAAGGGRYHRHIDRYGAVRSQAGL